MAKSKKCNKKGGKNSRRAKRNTIPDRNLEFAGPGQAYCKIQKKNGGRHMTGLILGENSRTITCVIRGKLKKRVWMNEGDIVLVALRDFEEAKCDIELKYTDDEVRRLRNLKELNDQPSIGNFDDATNAYEDNGFVFDTI